MTADRLVCEFSLCSQYLRLTKATKAQPNIIISVFFATAATMSPFNSQNAVTECSWGEKNE